MSAPEPSDPTAVDPEKYNRAVAQEKNFKITGTVMSKDDK